MASGLPLGKSTRSAGLMNDPQLEQVANFEALARMATSVRRLTLATSNVGLLNSRQSRATELWREIRATHLAIMSSLSSEERLTHPYFVANAFGDNEELFTTIMDTIASLACQLPTAAAPVPAQDPLLNDHRAAANSHALPRITLPKFAGDIASWENFRDLFQSLVVNDPHISNVQKLHYLKTSVSGEALTLLQNISINERNFTEAWKLLKDRYANTHLVIFSLVSQLLNLDSVPSAKPPLLRALIDQTRSILASLKRLDQPVDQWSTLVVVLTVLRLDNVTRREWEHHAISLDEFPKFEELEKFIIQRSQSLTISELKAPSFNANSKPPVKSSSVTASRYSAHVSTAQSASCVLCNSTHNLSNCSDFKRMSSEERIKFVRSKRHCYNCLRGGHFPASCKVKNNCTMCRRKHSALLHDALVVTQSGGEDQSEVDSGIVPSALPSPSTVVTHFATPSNENHKSSVLLATAYVKVSTAQGQCIHLRVMLDQGSQCSFISEDAAQALHVDRKACSAIVTGIGDQLSGRIRQMTRVKVSSQYSELDSVFVDALIIKKLTPYRPRLNVDSNSLVHLKGLCLADSKLNSDCPIMMIIGADIYGALLREGICRFKNSLTAQASIFGWILSGTITDSANHAESSANITSLHVVSNIDLDAALVKFWHIEELPKTAIVSDTDRECEEFFRTTTTRDSSGRYCVKLPFKESLPLDLGNSSHIALQAYQRIERRLSRDDKLAAQYHEFLSTYLSMGHMISYHPSTAEQSYFIPHHPIIKEASTSTKLRVVFNASCPTSNGFSLNDKLHVGPKLHEELPSILLRWRRHCYVCTADVTKMFRQIKVAYEDTRYQVIFWRPTKDSAIMPYRLMTVTYGTSPAPYLALRTLKQLIEDDGSKFPLAAAALQQNIYVDDALIGASTIEGCLRLRDEVIGLMQSGCLPLRKWSSNTPELLEGLDPSDCEISALKAFQEDQKLRILGLSWSPGTDQFQFPVSAEAPKVLTKRSLLSYIAKLYDPLGLVAPVVIVAKLMIQRLWSIGLDWDTPVPSEIVQLWTAFCTDLVHLSRIHIPRWVETTPASSVQLHGFCDASQRAYAAAVYLRVFDGTNTYVHLLTSKTRVAPVAKTYVSIPRLELCGAELLSRVLTWVAESMDLSEVTVYAWCDSSVVLHWIAGCPSRWKIFVANRVSAIRDSLPSKNWRHVPTQDNPADLASRGMTAADLEHSRIWWHGPDWLCQDELNWPCLQSNVVDTVDLEERAPVVHIATLEEWDLAHRFSDWGKLIRVTSLLFKFLDHSKTKSEGSFPIESRYVSKARIFWCKYTQKHTLPADVRSLSIPESLPRRSRVASLDPFLDENDIMRVGGRLQHTSESETCQHPIVLADHPITRLIIRHAHLRSLHGGPLLTMRVLREQYWILRARTLVRGVISKCVPCARHKAQLASQKMAPLPSIRVNMAPPFSSVGIDYAGPFLVRKVAGRGQHAHKAWLALFVCMRVKAVHLELVMDCSTAAFLAAFRRFCSRRGIPSLVLSDNGTNFQGADKEIRKAFQTAIKNSEIQATLSTEGITWRFIPPSSPHFGGIWESGVKSVKHHLRRVISAHTLTIEEFHTLLCQVEACLNSRPLTPLHNDVEDFSVLTPGHFLIGRPLLAYPEPILLDVPESHLTRWQIVQRMRDHFWNAWKRDYLATLQKRSKWQESQREIKLGDLVLLHHDSPPAKWPLGRIIECMSGNDGLVRVCRVKTALTELIRPVHKLCKLPIEDACD